MAMTLYYRNRRRGVKDLCTPVAEEEDSMHRELEGAFSLTDRSAVVTGAGSGIGREAARVFSLAGARVAIGDLDESGLGDTAKEIERAGGEVVTRRVDVRRREDVEALVDAAVLGFGGIDVMANVAGIIRNRRVVDTDEAELDEVLSVNLKGVFFGCAAAARAMAASGGGSIINIASAGMDQPAEGLSAYAMSKAAVAMLTRTLAVEMGADGVRVNTIAPGFIDTSMTRRHFVDDAGRVDAKTRDALWSTMSSQSPLSRIGNVKDIAHAMRYLASDAAAFVTGQTLRPNGGVVMP